MKKLIILLFFGSFAVAQESVLFKPDSTEIIVFQAFQDSLNIEIQKNQEFFSDFSARFGKYYDKKYQYERFSNVTVDELEMELYDQRAAQRKLLTDSKLSGFLKDFLNKEIEYQYWHLIYAFPIIRGNNDQKIRRLVSVPEVLTKGFKKEIFNNQMNLKSQAFRNLIPYWVTYENSKANNYEKYTNILLSINDKVEYSLRETKGLVADYSLAQILLVNPKNLSNSLAQNIVSQINNDEIRGRFTGAFLDSVFVVNKRLDEEKKAKEAEEAKKGSFEFVDLKGKNFDFSKYKGKVIYLDFWASWCGPCKMQFPFSKKLHESIPDKFKKDIVFLYISIDDTIEKWKEGIKVNDLEEFDNGFTEGAWGSVVLQKLGIRSIPRYMLIDKAGKIVDPNAKRPSSPDILSELLKMAE